MKKSTREAQRKEKRRLNAQRRIENKKKLLAETDEGEEDDEVIPEEETEEVETEEEGDEEEPSETVEAARKDYYGGVSPDTAMVMVGPTSFAELDQERLERERAAALNDTTWDVRALVNNILADPDLDLSEKASAIQEVGTDFSARAQAILGAATGDEIDAAEEGDQTQKDLDLLSLEALIAQDNRHASATEILKAKISYGSRQNMPDSNFALVTTRGGKKIRKYPIHDKAHVRNALARAAQQMKAGGQGASDARAALPKIHAAAKRMGIGSSMKKERSAILVEKNSAGKWRWVGWVSNNFEDWDGDIFCEDAHKEYVEWWEKNKDASPVFVSWHTPGTMRESPVDFMTYEKGFLIMSGPLTDMEAAGLLKVQKEVELGMSHGTLVFARDPKEPRVVTKYRMYEVSDLPLEKAANPFTDFETLVKEVGMDKKQYLAALLGSEEKANKFLERTGLKQKALQDAGVASKEKGDEQPFPAPIAPAAPAAPATPATPDTATVVAAVMKEMDVDGLNAFVIQAQEAIEKVPVLEGVIKELQGDQNAALAEKLTPPAVRFAWSQKNRPSAAEGTVVKEDDPLHKAGPGVPAEYWLSQISGTAPIKSDEVK